MTLRIRTLLTCAALLVLPSLLLPGDLLAQSADSLYILTPDPGSAPRINGPAKIGVRPGHPLFYTVPVSGARPMRFSAKGLPKGLRLNKRTGLLTGSVTRPGDYTIEMDAANHTGHSRRSLVIAVGERIALTPPMGWNSWNIYGTRVTQALVLANAQAMASSGLIEHGWRYVNVDDGWQGARGGKWNAIQPDGKTFPDMGKLAAGIHALGLQAGLYSTPWVESYGHHIGGSAENPEGTFTRTPVNVPRNRKMLPYAIGKYTFTEQDVRQWAAWGYDYLKYDWNPVALPETKSMYLALRNSGRDIVLSLSNSIPFASIDSLSQYANAWRTGGDIRDNWKSLKSRLFSQDKWAPYAGPGHWNDPDMLVVGEVGWGKPAHPSLLTADEQYTHISAWCLMSVPLLLGADLTKLDHFTLSLLTNDEVLALDQDTLGKQATLVYHQGDLGILAKDLADGSKAAGMFNAADDGPQRMTLRWEDLHIAGAYIVRDLWRQKDLGTFTGSFSATVPVHGVVLVGLRKAP